MGTVLGDDFWGCTGTLWEAIWLAKAAQEPFLGCSRLVQAGPGSPGLVHTAKGCMSKAAPRLLQAAPSCSKLLQAAPGCSRLHPVCFTLLQRFCRCSKLLHGCSRLLPGCSKLFKAVTGPKLCQGHPNLWSPKLPKYCFWATAAPMLPMAALASLPKLPWNYPRAAPRLTYCPRACPEKLQTKDHKNMHVKLHQGSCGCPPTTHRVDGIATCFHSASEAPRGWPGASISSTVALCFVELPGGSPAENLTCLCAEHLALTRENTHCTTHNHGQYPPKYLRNSDKHMMRSFGTLKAY